MSNPLITLITPTGSRPEAFAQCERYIKNQTFKNSIQWIVIDDSIPETKCTLNQTYVRSPKLWSTDINTQRYNIDAALEHITGEYIFIIEDDDYYHPQYLQYYFNLLSTTPVNVVGEADAKYYNLNIPGHRRMFNNEHSSLCQTAFHKSQLPLFSKAVHSGELYFDVVFWNLLKENSIPRLLMNDSGLSVGIKGMPGRSGIGVGHKERGYLFDTNFEMLRKWTGLNAEYYITVINERRKIHSILR